MIDKSFTYVLKIRQIPWNIRLISTKSKFKSKDITALAEIESCAPGILPAPKTR